MYIYDIEFAKHAMSMTVSISSLIYVYINLRYTHSIYYTRKISLKI